MARDPHIARRHAAAARALQLAYPAIQRRCYRSPELEFASQPIADPASLRIPTRHGEIEALLFSPPREDIATQCARGELPPVHLLIHGGAFILRYPIEEGNVARYLASEVGGYVVLPDYHAAPQVRHPVAQQQCYDALSWVREQAAEHKWDPDRVSVGGPSAGGQIALEVALAAIEAGGYVPVAVSTEYGGADLTRTDAQRRSAKRHPVVGPQMIRLIHNTYFKDVDVSSGDVSPLRHRALDRMPPTLVLTAELDTLRHESNDLADKLRQLGVQVTHHEFPGVDHGFTHQKPVETAHAAISMLGEHLATAYRHALAAAAR